MKKMVLLFVVLFMASTSYGIGDYSELESPLNERIEKGCKKYAEKQAKKHLQEHFNVNSWAGGNIGAGSVLAIEEILPQHITLLRSQCYNMVAEVLELKLGWAPWQFETE